MTDPSKASSLDGLFHTVQEKFPRESLGAQRWYLVVLCGLVGGTHPASAGDLYRYLTNKPKYSTPEQRQALVRRMRECLLKMVPLIGIVKPLEGIISIGQEEKEEDKDYSFSREHAQLDSENYARGGEWLDRIYKHNLGDPATKLAAHKDFWWTAQSVTYGLYLSDHSILNDQETELVTLCAILIQNMKRETGWHLRGLRRVGVSQEDVEKVHQCMEVIAEYQGLKLDQVPRVKDIEHEV